MSRLSLSIREPRLVFAPCEAIEGTASWSLDEAPQEVELRLFWYARGKGEEDVGVADSARFEVPAREDRREFRLRVPAAGPLSFTGQLITLAWALELVAEPGEETQRLEILVSATGREIRLPALDKNPPA